MADDNELDRLKEEEWEIRRDKRRAAFLREERRQRYASLIFRDAVMEARIKFRHPMYTVNPVGSDVEVDKNKLEDASVGVGALNQRYTITKHDSEPIDYDALATESVEAAEALLKALEFDADKPIIGEYTP